MTTVMRHNVWVKMSGERPAPTHQSKRKPKPEPPPRLTVECSVCHEKTIARSADAPTLAGWTVGEWPAEPQEFGKVAGVCPKCAKAKAAVEVAS